MPWFSVTCVPWLGRRRVASVRRCDLGGRGLRYTTTPFGSLWVWKEYGVRVSYLWGTTVETNSLIWTTPSLRHRGYLWGVLCLSRTLRVAREAMSRLPTGASFRRSVTPSHHGSGSSHSPRHSRAFQDADSEPESGNSSEGSVKGEATPTSKLSTSPSGDKVTLNVAGKRFTVSPSLFLKHPETMLGR